MPKRQRDAAAETFGSRSARPRDPKLCLINGVVSMGRRNTQVEPDLHWKTKAKSLSRVGSAGTLSWLGFDRIQPDRSLLPGKRCRINALHGVVSTGLASTRYRPLGGDNLCSRQLSVRPESVPPGRDDPCKNFTKSSCLPNAWWPTLHAANLIRLRRKHQ